MMVCFVNGVLNTCMAIGKFSIDAQCFEYGSKLKAVYKD